MKLRNLLLTAAALAGLFSACSNEMDEMTSDNKDQVAKGNAFASFSFAMPNSGGTRAAGTTEDGSDAENQVTSVKIILFNATDDTFKQDINLERKDFTPSSLGASTIYTTQKPEMVAAGSYKVYVIVNPTKGTTEGSFTTLAAYQAHVEKVAQTTGEYCTDNEFMMTNAKEIETTTITEKNIITSPASVSVKVERLAAKVTFGSDILSFPIKDSKGDELGNVTFDAYKVINTRNSAYNLRRVGGADGTVSSIGGEEAVGNYVIENMFTSKGNPFEASVYTPNYSRQYNTYVAFRKLGGKQTLAYALENTMKAEAQLTGYSTAVIFRAKVALKEGVLVGTKNDKGDIYRYSGKYYATLNDLLHAQNNKWNPTLPDNEDLNNLTFDLGYKAAKKADATLTLEKYLKAIQSKELYTNYKVEYFIEGYCYYTTWFRHNAGTEANTAEIMEYVMVRNNIYRLSINTVAEIGSISSGTPGPIDPTKPEQPGVDEPTTGTNPEIPGTIVPNPEPTDPVIPFEPNQPIVSAKTYLNVMIEVLPWTVRDNGLDL